MSDKTTELGSTDLAPASLVDLITGRLRQQILSGALAPGERLIEEQITSRFGISRAPVREALRLLAQQGLIEHLPRRGTRVTTLSDQDARELFELRDVLERFALSRALPCTPDDLFDTHENLLLMRQAADTADGPALADAHRQFHTSLAALAGHRQLLEAYEPVLLKLQMHMALNLRREAETAAPDDSIRRHTALLEAVRSNDKDVVFDALSTHGAQRYLH